MEPFDALVNAAVFDEYCTDSDAFFRTFRWSRDTPMSRNRVPERRRYRLCS
jgi:hypothetical protein